VSAPENLRHR